MLFERGTQEVTATPAGEFVIARARQLVFNSRCLEHDVTLYRDRGLGDIAFGVGPFPAGTFLPPLLIDLRREHPDVNVRVEINNWELLVKRLLPLALECDNLYVLKTVAVHSESVLAAPHAAVADEVKAGELKLSNVPELPAVAAQMGVVTLQGRTLSPMAESILQRIAA